MRDLMRDLFVDFSVSSCIHFEVFFLRFLVLADVGPHWLVASFSQVCLLCLANLLGTPHNYLLLNQTFKGVLVFLATARYHGQHSF